MPTKECRNCGEHKPLSDFPEVRNSRDGRGVRCNPCYKVYWAIKGRYDAKNYADRYEQAKAGGDAFWDYKANSVNNGGRKRGQDRIMASDLRAIYERQGGCCYYCGVEVLLGTNKTRDVSLSFDHVIYGVWQLANIVAACNQCNRIKKDATADRLEVILQRIKEFQVGSV